MFILAITFAYVGLVFVHWGLVFAHFMKTLPIIPGLRSRRDHLGAALGFAFVPVYWVMLPFLTGFYQFGWLNPLGRAETEAARLRREMRERNVAAMRTYDKEDET